MSPALAVIGLPKTPLFTVLSNTPLAVPDCVPLSVSKVVTNVPSVLTILLFF